MSAAPAPLESHLCAVRYTDYQSDPTQYTPAPLTGRRVGVAVVDSGVTLANRPWLEQRVCEAFRVYLDGTVRSVYRRGTPPPRPPVDPDGHGTAMAELVGLPGLGMASEVELYCYGLMLRRHQRSSTYTFDANSILAALADVLKRPEIHVVNVSLCTVVPACHPLTQGPLPDEPTFDAALTALLDAGKVVVLTAGNLPPDARPGSYETGLAGRSGPGVTVGSANRTSGNWARSAFCLSFQRTAPPAYVSHVYAPGESIPLWNYGHTVGVTTFVYGTSAATALTSGLVALGVEKLLGPTPTLSPSDVRRLAQVLRSSGPPVTDPSAPPGGVRAIDAPTFLNQL